MTLKPSAPKQSHQFTSDIQSRLSVMHQSETSLHKKYSRPGHKLPVPSEITVSTYPYQQESYRTFGPKYHLLPSSHVDSYRPPIGQLYPKYHLPPLSSSSSPLSHDRLYTNEQYMHEESSQQFAPESHATFQHHIQRSDANRPPVKWEYETTKSQHYPEYRTISRSQSEQYDLTTQRQQHPSVQDEKRPLSDYKLTETTQKQQSHQHILTQQERPEYQSSSVRPDQESNTITTFTTLFNEQRFKRPTIAPSYEVIH